MWPWLEPFLLAWIPLFVVIDPVGVIPIFIGMTGGVPEEKRRRIVHQATVTAAAVAIGFMVLGKLIFRVLGISIADFQVAGGLVLLAFASRDLLGSDTPAPALAADFGVVPLGMPLIAGPATLTTLLILMDSVGWGYTLAALLVNLGLVNLTFRHSDRLARWIGMTGLRAISKLTSLLLVAIAVSMIRRGLQGG